MEADLPRILIIGATGFLGPYIAKASVGLGHPTFALLRPSSTADPAKANLVESFVSAGIRILHGSLEDHKNLVEAIRQVDIVISAVGREQLMDQLKVISAIKEVGTIKRFLPSDFGHDKTDLTGPLKQCYGPKLKIRRALEDEGVPFTHILCNGFARIFLANLGQMDLKSPPMDKVIIYGDGNTKSVTVAEEDIGLYTIKAAIDPRTLNKKVHLRPRLNMLTQNEMVGLWEEKIGKSLEKNFLTEKDMLKQVEDTPYPKNVGIALRHAIFVRGVHCRLPLGPCDVEGTQLYPEVEYITASSFLDRHLHES